MEPQVTNHTPGTRAKFFHPRTFGVMMPGTVVKSYPDGTAKVLFDVDGRTIRVDARHYILID